MKLLTKLFIFTLLITCPTFALADNTFPSFPMAFWGNTTLDGQLLPSGTQIEAFCNSSLIGQVTISESGIYGYSDSTKNKLLVSTCSGDILFKYILSGTTTPLTGTSEIKYTAGFVAGTTVNKNLDFITGNSTITVNANQISSLLNPNALALPAGATYISTPQLQVAQNITINNPVGTGNSSVTLPVNTIITTVSGENFDATALTASTPAAGTLSGLTAGAVMDGSLQWGIVNLGLQFSSPITLSIYVGDSFNGQTLTIVRSTSSSSGWTSDGIVSPATCVVSAGLCTFNAIKASYYATFHTVAITTGGGGGGGGGVSTPVVTTPTAKKGDANGDGKVDKYDFALLMSNWGL